MQGSSFDKSACLVFSTETCQVHTHGESTKYILRGVTHVVHTTLESVLNLKFRLGIQTRSTNLTTKAFLKICQIFVTFFKILL